MLSSGRFRSAVPFVVVLGVGVLAPTCTQAELTLAGPSLSLGSSPLTVPSLQWFDGGQQEQDQRLADRIDPQAVFARERSRTAFERLGAGGVGRLLSAASPNVIDRTAGGAAAVPRGAHVLRYAGPHAIDVSLPGRRRGIVESTAPVAKRNGHGRLTPIDLSDVRSAGAFAPANSDVGAYPAISPPASAFPPPA